VFHLESMDGMAKSKGLAFQSISGGPGKKGSLGGRVLARAAESAELGTNLELHCDRDCVSAVYVHRDSQFPNIWNLNAHFLGVIHRLCFVLALDCLGNESSISEGAPKSEATDS